LKQNPAASKIGDFNDANTILNLNMPDVKAQVSDAADKSFSKIPDQTARKTVAKEFKANQDEFSSTVTHAFSYSLQQIFFVATGLMIASTIAVFAVKERVLRSAKPDETPGE
jgi:hypothetical protein